MSAPAARHADRGDAAARAARAGDVVGIYSLRPDRLRTGPHRQLPVASCSPTCSSATSAGAACAVTLGHEHHRRRRQDHPRRGRGRRSASTSSPTAISSAFLADADALRMTRPDVLPRATEHIDEMVALIATLLERGHAYRTDDGSIFFRIASWPAYGRLARLDPEQLRVGERVEADEYGKDDVRDFALWKGPKPGEPSLGRRRSAPGRPGWHIECSAMSMRPPRAVVRHPHRRRRPHLPAPRGRDRPERGRDRPAVRPDVAALRAPPDERREDGEVDRQHRPRRRGARRRGRRRARCATR